MPNRNFDEGHGLRPSSICDPTGRIPYRSKTMLRSKCGLAQSNASFHLPVSNSTCSKWTQIESQTSVQQGHGQRYAQIWHRRHCCDYAYFVQEPMRIIAIPIPFCYSIWLCLCFAFPFVFVFQGQMMPHLHIAANPISAMACLSVEPRSATSSNMRPVIIVINSSWWRDCWNQMPFISRARGFINV